MSMLSPSSPSHHIAALFAVGPTGPGPLTDVVTAVAKVSKGAPDILEVAAAAAIAKSFPVLEEADITPGALGATPWGVVTFEKMTKPEAVSTLVLTNTPQ